MNNLVPSYDYHGAHKPAVKASRRTRWSDGSSLAFMHDLIGGSLPHAYDDCDVLYTDLPWQKGFGIFNGRAGVDDGRTYREFMTAVSGIIICVSRPVYLVTGRHALSLRQGKTFVASDANPYCIGYIAAHAEDWRPSEQPDCGGA